LFSEEEEKRILMLSESEREGLRIEHGLVWIWRERNKEGSFYICKELQNDVVL